MDGDATTGAEAAVVRESESGPADRADAGGAGDRQADRTAQNSAAGTRCPLVFDKVRLVHADRANMENSALSVIVLFIAATLYIMRRRVRLGRRKPTF